MATATALRCDCKVPCANIDEYMDNHVSSIQSWSDQTEVEEMVLANEGQVRKMIRDEPYARHRVAVRARKLASGWVPRPTQPASKPKPFCRYCKVVDGRVVSDEGCFNNKCTFSHGHLDRRPHIRAMYLTNTV